MKDARGEWWVTPAYDLPSSAVDGDRTMALPIGGRIRRQLSWPMLRRLAHAAEIPDRLAANVVRKQVRAASTWAGALDELPFDGNRIHNLRRLVRARIRGIDPDT